MKTFYHTTAVKESATVRNMESLKETVNRAPLSPGVYLMKNASGRILYVGKAKSLRKRLRQYVGGRGTRDPKVRAMMSHVRHIEYVLTDSEMEALVLELNFIKAERPPYNIMLRDDKSYPYIKVTLGEAWPRVVKTRRVKKDGARYFGPYPNADYVNRMVDLINDSFPIKKCARNLDRPGQRPCLNYHIGRCVGPCGKQTDPEAYREMVDSIIGILEGRSQKLLEALTQDMERLAAKKAYEKAAKVRDRIRAVAYIQEQQKVVFEKPVDQDYVAMAKEGEMACFEVFAVREGRLVGKDSHLVADALDRPREVLLGEFLKQYYIRSIHVPKELLVGFQPEEGVMIEHWLSEKREGKTRIHVPKRGPKRRLFELAEKNAREGLEKSREKRAEKKERNGRLEDKLKAALGLDRPLRRLEAYDISNLSGVYSVGSMVVFEGTEALKRAYRRFRIRTVDSGPDDYKSMQEILYRRLSKGIKEREKLRKSGFDLDEGKFSDLPDLLLVDGGLGHVRAAETVVAAFGLDLPVAGMKKNTRHETESLVHGGRDIPLREDPELFRFIARIQDETHRFALSYHKQLRGKALRASILDEIQGVGEKRKAALFRAFGSVDAIRDAGLEALAAVPGVDRRTARAIVEFFKEKGPSGDS